MLLGTWPGKQPTSGETSWPQREPQLPQPTNRSKPENTAEPTAVGSAPGLRSPVWPLWQSRGQEDLVLSRDSKVSGRRVANPRGTTKATVGHGGEMLGFRESVSTASSLGTAGHPISMTAAAQSELSYPGRTKAIMERGPLASLPPAQLPTLPSHLNIRTWPPRVPLP